MALEIRPVRALKDNYIYLLRDSATGQTAAVDPGDAAPVIDALESAGWAPLSAILCTHHHWDHVDGNQELVSRYQCRVVCSAVDRTRVPGATESLGDGKNSALGSTPFQALAIPGHTLGHTAFWFAEEKALFCGDTLFAFGAGRLFEGTHQQLRASLARIARLPGDTKVYYGHEYAATNFRFAQSVLDEAPARERWTRMERALAAGELGTPGFLSEELATNPFFRVESEGYRAAAGMAELSAEHAFRDVRERRNGWA